MDKDVFYILLCMISLVISSIIMWLKYRRTQQWQGIGGGFRLVSFFNTFLLLFSLNNIERMGYKIFIFAVMITIAISSTIGLAVIESRKAGDNTALWRAGTLSVLLLLLSAFIYKELVLQV